MSDSPPSVLLETLAQRTGSSIRSAHSVAGGDIARSYRIKLESNESLFLKSYAGLQALGIGEAEAAGLRWLAEPGAVRVPQVIAFGPDWLALEWIESKRPRSDHDEALGHGLAALHASGAPQFGSDSDNWIGRLPQRNAARDSWPRFYADCRLRPLRDRAVAARLLTDRTALRLDRLIEILPEIAGLDEAPARLHGDLWSGNRLVDDVGAPCLIDPAAYGGHREMDLAMMRLFGGFGPRVFEAYAEVHPIEQDAEQRIALHQVYPLLVHVCLFGRSYLGQLSATVDLALDRACVDR